MHPTFSDANLEWQYNRKVDEDSFDLGFYKYKLIPCLVMRDHLFCRARGTNKPTKPLM